MSDKNTRIMIELQPTWVQTMTMLLAIVKDGTPEGRRLATEELLSLASKVDAINSLPKRSDAVKAATILAAAFKDICNAADNGQAYTAEELNGDDFKEAHAALAEFDADLPKQGG